jgi:hypothetical protein
MQQQDFTRDRYGRPMVTPANGGAPEPYTRFSSHGSCLEDRFGLERWKIRTAGKGLATRADLFAQMAATPAEDTQRLDALMEQALEAGGGSVGANLGTALHEFAQHVDNGAMTTAEIPAPWAADIAAYRDTLAAAGLTVEPGLVEVSLVHDGLRLAGTADRFLRRSDGRLVCADLKTGKAIGPNPLAYAVQLAAYATAQGYDIPTGKRYDIGDVDHTVGLLIHVPAGRGECHLVEVDLVAALEAAHVATIVKQWQKRKDIVRKISVPSRGNVGTDSGAGATVERTPAPVAPVPTPVETAVANVEAAFAYTETVATPEHRAWLEKRVRRLVAFGDDTKRELAARWPAHVPKLRNHALHTVREIEAISDACYEIESAHGLPFPDRNPTDPAMATPEAFKPKRVRYVADEGGDAPQNEIDALRATINALPANQRALIADITKQATAARRGISIREQPTVRRCAIAAMLVDLVRLEDVELMAAVIRAQNLTADNTETLGAQIGRLSTNAAFAVATLARAAFDGTAKIQISDNGTIAIDAETQPNPTTEKDQTK